MEDFASNATRPRDFWLSCGHHLLDRSEGGGLLVTDSFLKAYLARPELAPPADACDAERVLHATLLADPRRQVAAAEIAALDDSDARENWRTMLAFRDHLVAHDTLEAAYLGYARRGFGATPPLFVNHLVHVILRNVLDGCTDPYVLRAAELFFRPQRMAVHDGSLIAADEDVIGGVNAQPVSPLVAMLGLSAPGDIDVLVDENAETYWERSDQFDMALDLSPGRRGLTALGEVIAGWVSHLLPVDVDIVPLVEAQDLELSWYVGLDVHATTIGDGLWNGEELDQDLRGSVAAIYRMTFRDDDFLLERAKGEPVHLIMALAPDMTLRLKPQNLVTGLPVRSPENAS